MRSDWRNQHTTSDTERAKSTIIANCQECGISLPKERKYCAPCSETVRERKRKENYIRWVIRDSARATGAAE